MALKVQTNESLRGDIMVAVDTSKIRNGDTVILRDNTKVIPSNILYDPEETYALEMLDDSWTKTGGNCTESVSYRMDIVDVHRDGVSIFTKQVDMDDWQGGDTLVLHNGSELTLAICSFSSAYTYGYGMTLDNLIWTKEGSFGGPNDLDVIDILRDGKSIYE